MASLAHAATGLGEGMLQQREQTRQQGRYDQQFGLQERGVALQERGFEADKNWREETFARGEMEKLDKILSDPKLNLRYNTRQIADFHDRRQELHKRWPSVFSEGRYRTPDESLAAEAPKPDTAPSPTPGATPTATGELRNPSLFGTPRPYETGIADPLAGSTSPNYVPPPPQQGPPAPADYQPITDEAVSGLMRETDPRFNMQQNALRPQASQPAAAPAAPAPAPRPDGRPQPGMSNRSVIELHMEQQIIRAARQSKDPSLAPEVQMELEDRVLDKITKYSAYNRAAAEELFTRIQAGEFSDTAQQSRAESQERIDASQDERFVFKPRELAIAEDANAIRRAAALAEKMDKQRLTEKDRLELEMTVRKYNLSVAQFRAELAVKKQEAVKRGLDINKMMTDPTWQQEFQNEIALKYGYSQAPYSDTFRPGPAIGLLRDATGGRVGGTPSGPGSGQGKVFNRKAFLEGTKNALTPEQQKQEIQKMQKAGYTIQ
jgi:hypothetical protein